MNISNPMQKASLPHAKDQTKAMGPCTKSSMDGPDCESVAVVSVRSKNKNGDKGHPWEILAALAVKIHEDLFLWVSESYKRDCASSKQKSRLGTVEVQKCRSVCMLLGNSSWSRQEVAQLLHTNERLRNYQPQSADTGGML